MNATIPCLAGIAGAALLMSACASDIGAASPRRLQPMRPGLHAVEFAERPDVTRAELLLNATRDCRPAA